MIRPDATCREARRRDPPASRRAPFTDPDAWSDDTFVDRADDIRAIVDAIAHDSGLAARVDLDRLALVGHSLGGYTVVG